MHHAQLSRIHTFLASSDIHLEHKLGITRAECLKLSAEMAPASAAHSLATRPRLSVRPLPQFAHRLVAPRSWCRRWASHAACVMTSSFLPRMPGALVRCGAFTNIECYTPRARFDATCAPSRAGHREHIALGLPWADRQILLTSQMFITHDLVLITKLFMNLGRATRCARAHGCRVTLLR